jgi:hypothetical protein
VDCRDKFHTFAEEKPSFYKKREIQRAATDSDDHGLIMHAIPKPLLSQTMKPSPLCSI